MLYDIAHAHDQVQEVSLFFMQRPPSCCLQVIWLSLLELLRGGGLPTTLIQ